MLTLLTALLFSCQNTAHAQAVYKSPGNKTTTSLFTGASVTDSVSRPAKHDTVMPSWFPSKYHLGAQVFNPADSIGYYYNGVKWLRATSRITLVASATLDFASTTAQRHEDLTITVTGASQGDIVSLGIPQLTLSNSCFTAFVSAANTVTVRFNNYSSGSIDPGSGTFKVMVTKL